MPVFTRRVAKLHVVLLKMRLLRGWPARRFWYRRVDEPYSPFELVISLPLQGASSNERGWKRRGKKRGENMVGTLKLG